MSHRFSYPSLMGPNLDAKPSELPNPPNSDVALSEYDDGYNNGGLDVCSNEFAEVANRELINRELVNLENAVVNIDNSNDVIIGPVTQFNVNGNVTIFHNKDGQPVEIEEKSEISPPKYTDVSAKVQKEDEVAFSARKKCTLRIYLIGVLLVFLVSTTAVILVFVLRKDAQDQIPHKEDTIIITNSSSRLIPKEVWGGRKAVGKMEELKTPVGLVILKHTAGGNCSNFEQCAKKMQTLQSTDIGDNDLPDIYFNFGIGADGNAYFGRGWNILPASRANCIEIVLIGNFQIDPFTLTMFKATKALLKHGTDHKYLSEDYKLIGHNQVNTTKSPGKNVLAVINQFQHFDPTDYKGIPLDSDPMILTSSTIPTTLTEDEE
ncbi:peptidoglycan-recognition protein LA isoform X4 [Diabrotica virgifera virgifera]|uniref:Peptidoglycan-recognition protein LA-like isoform X4 n=1 Tax=Diabrotica virgifera virgifera TaxID=50390 RepID=A0A6P7FTG2_DIAVI|nr:peptidoglycan-recognition protein LA isoform X4 [Diabrotica virgifera virgifera]